MLHTMEKTELGFIDQYIKETTEALEKWDSKLKKFTSVVGNLRRECERNISPEPTKEKSNDESESDDNEKKVEDKVKDEQVEEQTTDDTQTVVDDKYDESVIATQREWDIFEVHNKLRTNPQSFAPYIKRQLAMFVGRVMYMPDGQRVITSEGAPAWQ